MASFWPARAYYAITYDISFPNQSRNHWEFTRYVRRSEVTPLFHPRREAWAEHFARDGASIVGKTPQGRTTVWLLEMNTGDRLRWREILLQLGLLE